MNLFLVISAALFSIMNPLGTVPVFLSLTQGKNKKQIKNIALYTSINVLMILLVSFFLGKYLLTFFGISIQSLKIAGGMIIAASGFALLTGRFNEHKGMKKSVSDDAQKRSDISLTPLAIPMLAGPGTISLLITYNQEYTNIADVSILVAALIATSIIIYFILKSADIILKFLGASGLNALSRIIGFIVIAIGVEYILSVLLQIIKQ
ncbi:MAG: MarC family NAAT transporter [Bacteroidetes bacterium]|nr:MarC family NAAT transporter [Bacteroidota bacterium]